MCFVIQLLIHLFPIISYRLSIVRYNPNGSWIRNKLRGMNISYKRSKKNGSSSSSESSPDDDSSPCSSQTSTDSEYSSYSSISSQSSQSSQSSEDEENSSRLLCKVCLDNELEVVFMPCGHFVSCSTCSQSLSKCPYCRKRIHSAVKTYLS